MARVHVLSLEPSGSTAYPIFSYPIDWESARRLYSMPPSSGRKTKLFPCSLCVFHKSTICINRDPRCLTTDADGPSAVRLRRRYENFPADGVMPVSAFKDIPRWVPAQRHAALATALLGASQGSKARRR